MGIEELLIYQAKREGYEMGVEESKREIALRMKNMGFDTQLITKYTGLSSGEIKKLSKKSKLIKNEKEA